MGLTTESVKSLFDDGAYDYRVNAFKEFLSAPVRDYKESPTTREYVDITTQDLEKLISPEQPSETGNSGKTGDCDIRVINAGISYVNPALEKDGVMVNSISSLIQENPELAHKYIFRNSGRDRIEKLINASWVDGIFVMIPENASADITLRQESDASYSHSMKTVFVCGRESRCRIRDYYGSTGQGTAVQGRNIYIYVEEGSRLDYEYVQEKSHEVTDMAFVRSFLEDYAEFSIYHVSRGGSRVLFQNESELNGRGSDFRTYGVSFSNGSQRMDIRDSSFQVGTACNADIQVRGAVSGQSSTIHRGNVDIEADSVKSTGFYDSRILLLSREGHANSKPGLLIKNSDTKSKHGSAISDVDEEQIFYLRTRGIDSNMARAIVMEGFLGSPVEKSSDKELIRKVQEYSRELLQNV